VNRHIALALALLLVVPAGARASIKVSAVAQRASGILVQTLAAAKIAPYRNAYGIVLDPGPLIALRNRIVAAQATGRFSAQSLARAKQLYAANHNIAMATLQAAQAHNATAHATEYSLESRARVDWGAALGAALIEGGSPMGTLNEGKISLIEAVVTGAPFKPSTTAQGETAEGTRISLQLIGRATRLPSGLIGQGLYYAGPTDLSVGSPVSVRMTTGPLRAGVEIPATAIIYRHGHKFVFRETTPDQFDMVEVSGVIRMDGSGGATRYFVGMGLQPGQTIVVHGAGVLLSAAPKH
jgi:tetrahydromethanopterin S-methyltransferase subunit F